MCFHGLELRERHSSISCRALAHELLLSDRCPTQTATVRLSCHGDSPFLSPPRLEHRISETHTQRDLLIPGLLPHNHNYTSFHNPLSVPYPLHSEICLSPLPRPQIRQRLPREAPIALPCPGYREGSPCLSIETEGKLFGTIFSMLAVRTKSAHLRVRGEPALRPRQGEAACGRTHSTNLLTAASHANTI